MSGTSQTRWENGTVKKNSLQESIRSPLLDQMDTPDSILSTYSYGGIAEGECHDSTPIPVPAVPTPPSSITIPTTPYFKSMSYQDRLAALPIEDIDPTEYIGKHSCCRSFKGSWRLIIGSFFLSLAYWIGFAMMISGVIQYYVLHQDDDMGLWWNFNFVSGFWTWVCFALIFSTPIFVDFRLGVKDGLFGGYVDLLTFGVNWAHTSNNHVRDRIAKYKKSTPVFMVKVHCYHTELKAVTQTQTVYRNGQSYEETTTTMQMEVVTKHEKFKNVPIVYWRDISPENLLDVCEAAAGTSVLTSVTYNKAPWLLSDQLQLETLLKAELKSKHRFCDLYCDVGIHYSIPDCENDDAEIDSIINNKSSCQYYIARVCCFNKVAMGINLFVLGCWVFAVCCFKRISRTIPFESRKGLVIAKPDWCKTDSVHFAPQNS